MVLAMSRERNILLDYYTKCHLYERPCVILCYMKRRKKTAQKTYDVYRLLTTPNDSPLPPLRNDSETHRSRFLFLPCVALNVADVIVLRGIIPIALSEAQTFSSVTWIPRGRGSSQQNTHLTIIHRVDSRYSRTSSRFWHTPRPPSVRPLNNSSS